MCGIVGATSSAGVMTPLARGLTAAECPVCVHTGVALVTPERLCVVKDTGPVVKFVNRAPRVRATAGIGRTLHDEGSPRGPRGRARAQPHVSSSGRIALVHEGTLEGADELRKGLVQRGVSFATDSSGELLAQLVEARDHGEPVDAVRSVMSSVGGRWAMVVAFADHLGHIVAACHGLPLWVGRGPDGMRVASRREALGDDVEDVIPLEEHEIVVLGPKAIHFALLDTQERGADRLAVDPQRLGRALRRQPRVLDRIVRPCAEAGFDDAFFGGRDANRWSRVTFLGSGSAGRAAAVAAYWCSSFAGVLSWSESYPQFGTRRIQMGPEDLVILAGPIDETMQSFDQRPLRALRQAQRSGATILRAADFVPSQRRADAGLLSWTTTFTSQLAALGSMVGGLTLARGRPTEQLLSELVALPRVTWDALDATHRATGFLQRLGSRVMQHQYALFLGRGSLAPVAAEGAWTLRSLTGVTCNACPSGELLHGPISTIRRGTPVIVLVDGGEASHELRTVVEPLRRRGAFVAAIHGPRDAAVAVSADLGLELPRVVLELSALPLFVPLQLLAHRLSRWVAESEEGSGLEAA